MSTLAMPPKEPIPYRVWKKVDQDPDLLQLVDADMLLKKIGWLQTAKKQGGDVFTLWEPC